MAEKLSKYQALRAQGKCTRDCGRLGEQRSHKKGAYRRSECRICATTSHGRANKK